MVADDMAADAVTCFETAHIGISKATLWYQYGFSRPQTQIDHLDKVQVGRLISRFREHVVGHTRSAYPVSEKESPLIVIFSRTQNRLILNENELATALSSLGMEVVFVRLEETRVVDMVHTLMRAKIAIGMHGSILILVMFMPRGSLLVELFPFAVPADNYTPYKTMASLPGMLTLAIPTYQSADLHSRPPSAWDIV